MKLLKKYLWAFIFLSMLSCITPYNPDISRYENVFVVDGEINNLPGPYTVRLSKSYEFFKDSDNDISGAQIKIIDNNGLEFELDEISKGTYCTTDSTFRGIVGNSYKIQITYENQLYESDFETILNPIPIDSIYWESSYNYDNNIGIQLFLDTHDPSNKIHYYSWEFEETWRFEVPLELNDKPEWKECFKKEKSLNFDISTTSLRNQDIIERHPLIFIGENTNKLYSRYSILVRQYALNEKAYDFLKNLITINQNQGSLFDPTPFSLVGNVKNVSDNNMLVLGNFFVTGASEKRIFIDRSELPKNYSPTDGFDDCSSAIAIVPLDLIDYHESQEIDSLMKLGYRVYEDYVITLSRTDTVRQINLAKPFCVNCTLSGESEIPSFWTEKQQ